MPLVLLCGCLPRVIWLPDSSGIVYTAGPKGNHLHVHDPSRGRSLVKELPGPVNVPAVRGDGRQLAVALLSGDAPNARVRILVHDRNGSEVHRSEPLAWPGTATLSSAKVQTADLFWESGGTRLLIAADNRLGMYDLKSQGLRMLPGNFGPGPLIFGGEWRGALSKEMLVRRDGEFAVLDWDGGVQPIQGDKVDLANQLRDAMTTWPAIFSSRWDGGIAEVGWNSDRFRFDVSRRTVSFARVLPERADGDLLVQQRFSFGPGKASVRVVETVARNFALGGDGQEGTFGTFRVEVLKPGVAEAKVALATLTGNVQLVPSPNRRLLAVDCLAESTDRAPQERSILIIDADGRLVSQTGTVVPKLGHPD